MVGYRNKKMMTLLALFALAVAFAPGARAGSPGDAGLLSLRMGIGAREAAMGETGVASSFGASAVYWNPANNVFADFDTGLVLQHHRYLGLFNHESAALAHRVGKGVLGFIFMGFYSDSIDRYGSEPVGIPEGTFKPYDVAFAVSYAHPLGDSFAAAVNAKFIYEKIDIYSDVGFAFDFFLTHKSLIEGLMFAASATNVGSQMNLKDEPFDLPTAFRIGAAWTPVGDFLQEKALKVRAEFINANGLLRAGMFAKAIVTIRKPEPVLLIPKEAVQWDGCCNVVFIRRSDVLFEPRKVLLDYETETAFVAAEGVREGDTVVTTGSFLLKTEILKGSIGAGCCPVDPDKK